MNSLSEQTPRNYDKIESYTSPIGLLKNFTTSLNAGIYEEQFFKIKSQRLQTQIQELKQENLILKHKLNQTHAIIQILKDKLYMMEKTYQMTDRSSYHKTATGVVGESSLSHQYNSGPADSKYLSIGSGGERSQRLVYNNEIERLLKQNRVLKNEHEIQVNQLRDENKKLNRKLSELQGMKPAQNQSEQEEKKNRVRMEQRNQKLQKSIHELRKDYQQLSKQRNKLQQKLKIIEENNKALRRESQQLKQRESEKIQLLVKDHRGEIQRIKNEKENKKIKQQKQFLNEKNKKQHLSNKDQNKQFQQKQPITQIQVLKRKILLDEKIIKQKDDQIKNILIKLKPLLQNQKKSINKYDQNVDNNLLKNSLSILQLFLKKYKINLF